MPMHEILAITRALSDESRIRAVMMLTSGELCVCQIIEALKLAPATVSKHMSILHEAGLVQRQKRGKWAYYQLASREASAPVRRAIRWLLENLQTDKQISRDRKEACCVRESDPSELTGCYNLSTTHEKSASVSQRLKPAGKAAGKVSKTRR